MAMGRAVELGHQKASSTAQFCHLLLRVSRLAHSQCTPAASLACSRRQQVLQFEDHAGERKAQCCAARGLLAAPLLLCKLQQTHGFVTCRPWTLHAFRPSRASSSYPLPLPGSPLEDFAAPPCPSSPGQPLLPSLLLTSLPLSGSSFQQLEDYVAPRQLDASELPAIVDQYRQVGLFSTVNMCVVA